MTKERFGADLLLKRDQRHKGKYWMVLRRKLWRKAHDGDLRLPGDDNSLSFRAA